MNSGRKRCEDLQLTSPHIFGRSSAMCGPNQRLQLAVVLPGHLVRIVDAISKCFTVWFGFTIVDINRALPRLRSMS